MLKPKAFFLPLLLFAAPAAADPIEDGQLWSTVSASGSLSGKWQGQLETITRIGSDFSEHYQQEFLAGIGYELSDKATVSGGYVRVIDFRPGNDRTEHRPFQQLSLDLGKIGSAKLSSRTRLEQRFVEGGDDMGLRLRQRLQLSHPVSGKLSANAGAEFFFALNDTDWGARSGFERWRIGAGLRHPIAKNVNFDIGYLNQFNSRRNRRDSMDHIVTTGLSLSW